MKNETKTPITCITHSADYDGVFSQQIARKFLPPDTIFIGWDFGNPKIPFPDGQVYIIDLSPDCLVESSYNPDTLRERLIWIDHHKSSIEKWPTDLDGYRIDGVAACRLAWQWFAVFEMHNTEAECHASIPGSNLPNKQQFVERKVYGEPLAVTLAGEYDTWNHEQSKGDDIIFQFGLDAYGTIDWDELLQGPDHTADVHRILNAGRFAKSCYAKRDADVMRERSFKVQFAGLTFLVLNTARCNSNTFAALDVPETGHDALMAFYWTGTCYGVSMYHAAHRKDLDLSEIAVNHGGGGHRGACGFRATKLPFLP